MKKAGIVLIVLQLVSLIPSLISGEPIFSNGIAWLIGRFLLGIIGVILLIVDYKRNGGRKGE